MNAWSSMVAKFHDHFTPAGRRASGPERMTRKRHRRQVQELHTRRRLARESKQRDGAVSLASR